MDSTQRLRIFRPQDDDCAEQSPMLPSTIGNEVCMPELTVENTLSSEHLRQGPADLLTERQQSDCNPANSSPLQKLLLFTGCCLGMMLSGCAAFVPLKGIPVRKLPWEYMGQSRENMETIDLTMLSQTPPLAHLVDSGDILAVYIEGMLGKIEEAPPVYIPQNPDSYPALGYPIPIRDDGTISLPSLRPIFVRGMTVAQIEETVRRAYTDEQVIQPGRERILISLQKIRTHKVTVLRQETSNAQVVSTLGQGGLVLGESKKGTGQIVALAAGENDVLRALTLTGGLPGLDAQNAIFILRRPRRPAMMPINTIRPVANRSSTPIRLVNGTSQEYGVYPNTAAIPEQGTAYPAYGHSLPSDPAQQSIELESQTYEPAPWNQGTPPEFVQGGYSPPQGVAPITQMKGRRQLPAPPMHEQGPALFQAPGQIPEEAPPEPYVPAELQPYLSSGSQIIRIPIRLYPGEPTTFTEEDIKLYDGDIVFIESRESEVFYTGGLLGGGQFELPRDYDLGVLEAVSIAQGRSSGGGGGGAGFGNRIGGISALNQDISVSASTLIIIRKLPNGQRVNIKVDMNRVLRESSENIVIQPGDYLVLRYKPMEAVAAFIERNLLAGSLIGIATQQAQGGR